MGVGGGSVENVNPGELEPFLSWGGSCFSSKDLVIFASPNAPYIENWDLTPQPSK